MPSQTVVQVRDVSKRFIIRKEKSLKERLVNFGRSNLHKHDFWALRDVNLEIEAGTTVGLIGPNGSGKSTLLKMIGGIIQPTTGEIRRRGRLAALLELGAGFHPDLTGRENVYLNAAILGLTRKETEFHFQDILDFSGIGDFIDTQVKFYSSGMYVRLAFAVAVHVDPDILIVDEVLAVGDEPFQRKCMDRIRAFQRAGKTIVLVTHSLDLVGDLCDRAVVLEHGQVMYDGDPATALSRLRQDFEGMRETADDGPSTSIKQVSVLDEHGQPIVELQPGQRTSIEVEVELPDRSEEWIVGMGIETPLGQIVYGTNTELLGFDPQPAEGILRVRFDLGEMWLGSGQYFVHASYGTLAAGELNRLPQAATINVGGDPRSVGVLGLPAVGVVATSEAIGVVGIPEFHARLEEHPQAI